ncbi:MAG: hypothetical protein HGA85_05975 [Nanoarchaeota archaeon]|nr:hypothetical protein [Nanoarchaeota archaeon]
MKKIMSIFVLGMLLLTLASFAVAEEDPSETTDAEIEQEIETMSTPPGAEYRLDQLELSLENQIEHAKDILSEINVSDEAMEELEGYVVKMELLLERVQAMVPTGTPEEMAAEFVAAKKEAITLSQDFRKSLYNATTKVKIDAIKERIQEIRELRKAEIESRLEDMKDTMYMRRISSLLEALGLEDQDIMEKVKNGEMTKEEAKEIIKKAISELTPEQKEELKSEVKEMNEQVREDMAAKRSEFKASMQEKREEIKSLFQARFAERRAAFEARMSERKNNMQERLSEFQDRMKERLDKAGQRRSNKTDRTN